jgi:hypothetical protein
VPHQHEIHPAGFRSFLGGSACGYIMAKVSGKQTGELIEVKTLKII